MLHHAHLYMKGGEPPFAAVCTKVSYAQKANFAKLHERPKGDIRDAGSQCPLVTFKIRQRTLNI
jgi:hypothetical protein